MKHRLTPFLFCFLFLLVGLLILTFFISSILSWAALSVSHISLADSDFEILKNSSEFKAEVMIFLAMQSNLAFLFSASVYWDQGFSIEAPSFSNCTDQVVGSDDVAASDNIGVLNGTPGWRKGRTLGSSCSRQSLSWCAPISNISKPAVARLVS